jgi:hypothetical protein
MAARPSAFRAAQTARWASTVGTTPTGSGIDKDDASGRGRGDIHQFACGLGRNISEDQRGLTGCDIRGKLNQIVLSMVFRADVEAATTSGDVH